MEAVITRLVWEEERFVERKQNAGKNAGGGTRGRGERKGGDQMGQKVQRELADLIVKKTKYSTFLSICCTVFWYTIEKYYFLNKLEGDAATLIHFIYTSL